MNKNVFLIFVLGVFLPTVSFATSYDMRAIEARLYLSLIDELILFIILPIFLLVSIFSISKQRKIVDDDLRKKKIKSKTYTTIALGSILLVIGLVSAGITNTFQLNLIPCGFNMRKSCSLTTFEILQRNNPFKHRSEILCPPGTVVEHSGKSERCILQN